MSITIQCPKCGKRYTVADSAAGKVATCQGCGVKMRIPAAPAAPKPPAPAPQQPPQPEPPATALPTEMRANRALAGRTCPVCGQDIGLGQQVRNCELCGQTHHLACWTKNNGCGTRGCDNAPLPELKLQEEPPAPGAAPPPVGETKKCPYCGEDIAKAAVKCRFCGEYLDKAKRGRPRFQRKSDKARNALICGIIGIFCCGIILGPIAIVLALNAKKEIATSRGALTGAGMATAGLVCGIIATVLNGLGVLIQIIAAASQ